MNWQEKREFYKKLLLQKLEYAGDMSDWEVYKIIDELLLDENLVGYFERKKMRKELFHGIRGLDFLDELMEDVSVSEIMINGPNRIFVEKEGHLIPLDNRFESDEKLHDIIQRIVAKCNRVVNESNPIVDARLEDGSRVNVVLKPVALNGPILTIRKFPDRPIGMEELISFGTITKELSEFLKKLVLARYNIFISGGTGSGKTTFLNALSNFISEEERIITIEDSAELQLQNIPNLVQLETRNANVEGCKAISIRDLIKSSLRMRPERIIVGECRGGETLDMLQAMNTGHDGSMSTGHANSTEDMLVRLETMVLMGMELPLEAIRKQIASGIDILIHLGRMRDKTRKLLEISEVLGVQEGQVQVQCLYRYREEGTQEGKGGNFEKVSELAHQEKLLAAGLSL